MYHSITFGSLKGGKVVGKNTWDDWHLIPSSRPCVAQAGVSTSFRETPGASGSTDMSDYLTGYTIYESRKGSFDFYVDNDHEDWITLHEKIQSFLHGKQLVMSMEDEPDYYYAGRFSFNNWKSESWNSKVVIDYVLEPMKYQAWLWDPFNFMTDSMEGRL